MLYWKNKDEETWGTTRTIAVAASFFSSTSGLPLRASRASRWPMTRLVAPNFRVLLETPMIVCLSVCLSLLVVAGCGEGF